MVIIAVVNNTAITESDHHGGSVVGQVGRFCPAAGPLEIGIGHYVEMSSSEVVNQETRPFGGACVRDENVAFCHGTSLPSSGAPAFTRSLERSSQTAATAGRAIAIMNKEAQMARLIRVDSFQSLVPAGVMECR
jgi:hypothetical protein